MDTAPSRSKIVIGLALIGLWVSLWLSYRPVPLPADAPLFAQPPPTVGTGGFPFLAFDYPVPPMGNDHPPASSLFPFAVDVVFWIAVACLLAWAVPKRFFIPVVERVIIGLSLVLTFFGLGYLLIKFD